MGDTANCCRNTNFLHVQNSREFHWLPVDFPLFSLETTPVMRPACPALRRGLCRWHPYNWPPPSRQFCAGRWCWHWRTRGEVCSQGVNPLLNHGWGCLTFGGRDYLPNLKPFFWNNARTWQIWNLNLNNKGNSKGVSNDDVGLWD